MKVLMPQLGETVSEGTIAVWHVKVGDTVKKNDPLLDVETDKAALEVPAQAEGVITSIAVETGATVDVGVVLCEIEVDGEEPEEVVAPAKSEPAPAPAPVVASTDMQSSRPPAAKVDSAAMLPPAVRRLVAEHDIDVAAIPATGKRGRPTRQDVLDFIENGSSTSAKLDSEAMLSPAVRRLVAEHHIDVAAIPATGKRGRTTRQDVLNFINNGPGVSAPATGGFQAPAASASAPIVSGSVEPLTDQLIPWDRIRKLTAEHMIMSKSTSPHVLQAVEVQYTAVDAVRKGLSPFWKKEKGYSLTYLPFIARALTMAIHEFPHINASIEGEALRLHPKINIAIAVDLNFKGLVAPVVKDCAQMSVSKIAENIRELSIKARSGKLSPDDFAGGTYTISNSGPFGTLMTAPVINQPQVAIVSTDGIRKRPVVIEDPHGDTIAIRPVGILAQSFDHRAFDGAYSAAFLNRVRDILEQHDWSSEF